MYDIGIIILNVELKSREFRAYRVRVPPRAVNPRINLVAGRKISAKVA